jgi:FemAB-related protein (PEP-CTERM system-associated)
MSMSATAARRSVEVVHTEPDRRALCRIADASADSSLAHAPEWLEVIPKAYGHAPLYLHAHDGNGGGALLPAFIVRRPFFGTAVTSMPFLDAGGPCSTSSALADKLVEDLFEQARRAGAKCVDLRCTQRLSLPNRPMEHKVNMVLPLPSDPESLWRQLDSNVRRRVRRAERSGLSVSVAGAEALDGFYAVFAHRMRELGTPVHARAFFAAVFEAFEERARLIFVAREGAVIGGLVALSFKDTLVVPWVTCLSQYFPLYPNMLLYWHTIRMACEEGYRRFDFGRSTRDCGTYHFKRQWGAEEAPLFWYSIPMNGRSSEPNGHDGRASAYATGIWQRLPLALTTNLGPRIRKYLIQ